jgi:HAD superfamily hydrolase (TIGR01509 family)
MNLTAKNYWIFDLDGTLTLAAHDFDAIKRRLGLSPERPILEQLLELPEERAGDLRRQLDGIERAIARDAKVQPGALELLQTFRDRDMQVGILTRNSHANALETLAVCGLAGFFDAACVLGRESCDPKPSGAGVRQLLRRWQAPPEHAVMVGDYLFDLMAGRDAGTTTVYFDPSGEYEYAAHADLCVRDLLELRSLVEGSDEAAAQSGA